MTGDLHHTLLTLETRVWQALVDGDAEADAGLLSENFLGVYPSGFAGRGDHVDQLAQGPSVLSFDLGESRVLDLGPGLAMFCYLARYRRVGRTDSEEMYVSSLWQEGPEGWNNLFSQDTPRNDTPVP